jgi:hypothetical protein
MEAFLRTYVSHGKETFVKEEDNTEESENDPKTSQSNPNLCITLLHLLS